MRNGKVEIPYFNLVSSTLLNGGNPHVTPGQLESLVSDPLPYVSPGCSYVYIKTVDVLVDFVGVGFEFDGVFGSRLICVCLNNSEWRPTSPHTTPTRLTPTGTVITPKDTSLERI